MQRVEQGHYASGAAAGQGKSGFPSRRMSGLARVLFQRGGRRRHPRHDARRRCSMVNLDLDSASPAPKVLKVVVRANQNAAGIYSVVTRIGRLAFGPTKFIRGDREMELG